MDTLERKIVKPGSKKEWLDMRTEVVTSTEISALFGCCPYLTEYELWFRKRDRSNVEVEENERMKWGTRLQDPIANGVAEDNGWTVRRMDEFISIPSLRIGSSFDFAVSGPKKALLEVKNVDGLAFRNGWFEQDGDIEALPHIEFQVQHQMLVSGDKEIYIAALIGGNKIVLLRREANQKVFEAILSKTKAFWDSIDRGVSPSPVFPNDASFIINRYQFSEPGKIIDVSGDTDIASMISEYQALGRIEKMVKEGREEIKAKILMKIGDAEKATAPLFTISAGVVGPAHVEYDREGYRSFRVFEKKIKEPK